MSACTFSIAIAEGAPLEPLYEKARQALESQGGTFSGDMNGGSFHVSMFGNNISGSFKVENNELNVVVDEKPFMVPCSMIESYLKNKLS